MKTELLNSIGATLARLMKQGPDFPLGHASLRRGYRPSAKNQSKYMPHVGAKEHRRYIGRDKL